jgi:hypothetical protein
MALKINNDVENKQETVTRSFGWGWILWPGAVLILYILSTGPMIMMVDKKMIAQRSALEHFIEVVYKPIHWATHIPPLAKPLGLYWHIWAPHHYDTKGAHLIK